MAASPESLKALLRSGSGIASGLQAGVGLAQFVGGLIGQSKGRKELKGLMKNMPQYTPDTGIMSYYNQALQRAGYDPRQSSFYKSQMQNIGRIAAQGLQGAQDRRGGLATASSISRGMSKAALDAEGAAEAQQERRFGLLGSAAQMAGRERRQAFDINVMQPFEMRRQMAAQRAASGAQTANIGMSNIFRAGTTLAQADMYRRRQRQGDTEDNL
jgi:hypothetical protein